MVVSYYAARPPDHLAALMDELSNTPSGWPFTIRVVVHRDDDQPLELPSLDPAVQVFVRPNHGYNLGAWEAGWRQAPECSAYLFLQDECRVLRSDWLAPFIERASQPGVGLVGERLSPPWNVGWPSLRKRFAGHRLPGHAVGGRPADRLDCYFDFFARQGIAPGAKGDHLQSLVLFARREVLEAVGGFPIGENYGEAIAAEIGMSKKVQAAGLSICEVGPAAFWCFDHPQWTERNRQHRRSWLARFMERRPWAATDHRADR